MGEVSDLLSQNVALEFEGGDLFSLRVSGPQVLELFKKYHGQANVKLGRPETPGTEQQNRAMHALLCAYYLTGMHSAPEGCTLDDFKIYMKVQYGPCYEMDYQGRQVRVPKSWADYSKQERVEFIDALISEINQSGAYSASQKIRDIIAGMQQEAAK